MRRVLLLCVALMLLAGPGWAQGSIQYHPPQLVTSTGGFLAPGSIELKSGDAIYLYNTADRVTDYERVKLSWEANVFTVATQKGGTGADRGVTISSLGALTLRQNGGGGIATAGGGIYPVVNDSYMGTTSYGWSNIFILRSIQGSKSKSLTDAAAAVAYATIAVPTNAQIAGELIWTAASSAAAVRFVANGSIRFWGTDEGGTPVCGINKIGTDGEGHSSGAATLVCTWTNVVATTNCALSVTCTNSTAGVDPVTINARLDMPTAATVTFN